VAPVVTTIERLRNDLDTSVHLRLDSPDQAGTHREAMPLLARVDESDLFLNIDSRFLLLKMYYETGEWDALDALIASFKILLLPLCNGM
jgi:hypothetical protein